MGVARRFRKLRTHKVKSAKCPHCKATIVLYENEARVSHATPICDGFRWAMEAIAAQHGATITEGASYLAALVETGQKAN